MTVTPLSDDALRAVFRWVLDADPECPLRPDARKYGSGDTAVAYLMAGFLVATVRKASGETIQAARAIRIVKAEFDARRRKGLDVL